MKSMSYKDSGVDIDTADQTKKEMKRSLETSNPLVLNRLGAFASLVEVPLKDFAEPVLVLKMEEPGSKQLLAAQHGRLPSVGIDLVNHLLNDTVVMGARPLAVLDTIICGKLEKDIVVSLVEKMSQACKENGCDLVGGETSEQPGVIPDGSYILSASSVGIVDKAKIIDGTKIKVGDVVLGIASNGIHTNGYTLVRRLLEQKPGLADVKVEDTTFIDIALRPHLCYSNPLQEAFGRIDLHGLAHITGGGVVDNLARIIPEGLSAQIDLGAISIPEIFSVIKREGGVAPAEMLRTFNLGVGLIAVVSPAERQQLSALFAGFDIKSFEIGRIIEGSQKVVCDGELSFC